MNDLDRDQILEALAEASDAEARAMAKDLVLENIRLRRMLRGIAHEGVGLGQRAAVVELYMELEDSRTMVRGMTVCAIGDEAALAKACVDEMERLLGMGSVKRGEPVLSGTSVALKDGEG